MKKQNFKSLLLNRNTISNFDLEEINGGISGGACGPSSQCQYETVVHSCNYSDLRTCSLSYVQCTA
jgi:hypothetical protein